jgi:hypothetical protein
MAREISLDKVLHRSYAESLRWIRREIEQFPPEEQQAIADCEEKLRHVLESYEDVEDMALLLIHYEYMARMEWHYHGGGPQAGLSLDPLTSDIGRDAPRPS